MPLDGKLEQIAIFIIIKNFNERNMQFARLNFLVLVSNISRFLELTNKT